VGQAVLERVCQPCWSEWLTTQVRIINEYGLQLYNPTHRAELTRVMKQFLNLQDE
jgi:Fe-S cluster biosynthesis and repair protein YggX